MQNLEKQNLSDNKFINSCQNVLKKHREDVSDIKEMFYKKFGKKI